MPCANWQRDIADVVMARAFETPRRQQAKPAMAMSITSEFRIRPPEVGSNGFMVNAARKRNGAWLSWKPA